MTDKVQKIEQIDESTKPEFAFSKKGGYAEEQVDKWLTQHFEDLKQIIEYQNHCVDVTEELTAAVEAAEQRATDAESRLEEATRRAAALETELEEARNTPAPAVAETTDSAENDGREASAIITRAVQVANEHIEAAKVDADKIRENAEGEVVDLRREIEHLDGVRAAAYQTLVDFFDTESAKLRNDSRFTDVPGNAEVVEDAETVEAEEETPQQSYPSTEYGWDGTTAESFNSFTVDAVETTVSSDPEEAAAEAATDGLLNDLINGDADDEVEVVSSDVVDDDELASSLEDTAPYTPRRDENDQENY